MFSIKTIPSTASVLSTYTTFTATAMLVRGVISEVQAITSQLIPTQLQDFLLSKLGGLYSNRSSQMMNLLIDESDGYSMNELYEASEIYLQTKITPSMERLKVSKGPKDKKVAVTIEKGEEVIDIFEGIQLKWEVTCVESKDQNYQGKSEKRVIELSFDNKYMEKVINSYLEYVIETSKVIQEKNQVVKLFSLGDIYGGDTDGTNLDHPATFDKLAMDPVMKKELIDDLNRFVRRRDFYRKVGKAWKRGYLLYGPPGTGKSSLVAAMANYLKFNVYDLELASIHNNSDLRRLSKIDKLGEMKRVTDSTPSGFRVLASNYLDITSHDLFDEIDQLLMEVEATPAELAEELMKSEDVDIALEGLIKFLQNKKLGSGKFDSNGGEAGLEEEMKAINVMEVAGNKNINRRSTTKIYRANFKNF
ncbi:ATPase, AAA-type, core [Corchorus capsularis]|uniref:ATPase, AAA-type, core n=1 Tax=Corchorus capsularis TaxID=210143 RepID=A0A1R3GR32_COCAP|nr:ATPase, AAA-type, core [Corchorus capsularis]